MSSLKGVVNCYVFTTIFAVFLYHLASAYQISFKRGALTAKLWPVENRPKICVLVKNGVQM